MDCYDARCGRPFSVASLARPPDAMSVPLGPDWPPRHWLLVRQLTSRAGLNVSDAVASTLINAPKNSSSGVTVPPVLKSTDLMLSPVVPFARISLPVVCDLPIGLTSPATLPETVDSPVHLVDAIVNHFL